MKVIVTGANGFVGLHLVKELAEHGVTVFGVGGPHGSTGRSEFVHDYLSLDLRDEKAAHAIDFRGIDGVIHLAGLATLAPSFDAPMEYINTNMGMETNLFEAARKQDVRPRFLIVSSATLYDPKASLPFTETSPVVPGSPYAVSKLGQEQLGQYYHMRGFECIIARPFNHIGPGQGPGFIVPDLTQQVIAFERGEDTAVSVGNLDAQRDYTDVRDIVRAYRLLLAKGKSGEIYNICSGKPVSGHDILSHILGASGTKPPIKEDPARMRPSDTPAIYGSYQKLTDDTDWKPEIDMTTTFEDVVRDWRNR